MTLSTSYKATSESSKLTLQQWLKTAEAKLTGYSTTPRLDAQLIAELALRKDKFWLITHNNVLRAKALDFMNAALGVRLGGMPIAYILGEKEFYGRSFFVTKDVLIPRPETETLINKVKTLLEHKSPISKVAPWKLLDVGTGSGIIAITAALEWPTLQVYATDISQAALDIAKLNAKNLNAAATFSRSDLLKTAAHSSYDFIVANLPYVDKSWQRSPETNYEPSLALFAEDGGLAIIERLIKQAPVALRASGYLLLEADPRQHTAIRKLATKQNLVPLQAEGFAMVFQKPSA